jgi:hypothetical protein
MLLLNSILSLLINAHVITFSISEILYWPDSAYSSPSFGPENAGDNLSKPKMLTKPFTAELGATSSNVPYLHYLFNDHLTSKKRTAPHDKRNI